MQTATTTTLPPGSESHWPVTRTAFLSRLKAYQSEVLTRSLILLSILIVGSVGMIILGWWMFTKLPQSWLHYTLIIGFGLFLLTMIVLFVRYVYHGPLAKYGLRCGGCQVSLLEADPTHLANRGHCEACGYLLFTTASDSVIKVEAESAAL